ncbi:hypothetical protein N9N67_00295 [Bacteriovoracaceae bacterium]|nr:hypothetical protein [Bacteriovoracaceae bacterium]
MNIEKSLILIDDDILVHKTWKMMAEKKGQILFSYFDVESFMNDLYCYDKDIRIFIDSNLKNGKKGEREAERITKVGFFNIHLASGEILDKLPPWILSQNGKCFPD